MICRVSWTQHGAKTLGERVSKGSRTNIELTLPGPCSGCKAVSSVVRMAGTLQKEQKEVLFLFREMPMQFDKNFGSSNFSLLAPLSAAFSQYGRQFSLGIRKYTVVCV